MRRSLRPSSRFAPSLSLALLTVLVATLWLAGGASRADALGQAVVRGVAWMLLIVAILFGERPSFRDARPAWLFLLASAALVLLQLVPLPPELWQALPGRAMFVEAAMAGGETQPWRPWSISPDATLNAASSLVIPAAALFFASGVRREERSLLPTILLGLAAASMLLAVAQVSGAGINNPLVNDVAGQISGPFANRNHFALLMAIGCLLAPVWAFWEGRRPGWRVSVAVGLLLLFMLMILASGSRAGLVVGAVALIIGLLLARGGIRRELRRAPRWAFPMLIGAMIGTITLFVLISIVAGRAASIDRIFAVDPEQDMRRRALSTVFEMVQTYFPAGSGFGSFDPLFRIHEPFALLKFTYFNHAHNDFLEVILDGGLPALLLLLCSLAWWAFTAFRALRTREGGRHSAPKLGSAILLLVFIASIFDYPARTPIIMAIVAIAAMWLGGNANRPARPALPAEEQLL